MRTVLVGVFTCLVSLLLVGTASADKKFHSVPKAAKGGKTKLQLRVVAYDGDVNGALTVEIRNPTGKALTFSAEGLYFVPDVDADEAPQRLGAVGPMSIARGDGERESVDSISVGAEDTVKVTLDVFCIDEHRDAPDSDTAFTVGKKRMPAKLARAIAKEAEDAADSYGGYAPAKEDIQDKVWKTRNKKWVKLDGEGVQEKNR
jgi:hypothetical protein